MCEIPAGAPPHGRTRTPTRNQTSTSSSTRPYRTKIRRGGERRRQPGTASKDSRQRTDRSGSRSSSHVIPALVPHPITGNKHSPLNSVHLLGHLPPSCHAAPANKKAKTNRCMKKGSSISDCVESKGLYESTGKDRDSSSDRLRSGSRSVPDGQCGGGVGNSRKTGLYSCRLDCACERASI